MTNIIEELEAFLDEPHQLVNVLGFGCDGGDVVQRDVVHVTSNDEAVRLEVAAPDAGSLWVGVATPAGKWSIVIDPEAGPFIMAEGDPDIVEDPQADDDIPF